MHVSVVATAVAASLAATIQPVPSETFCARLAPQLGMERQGKSGTSDREWRADDREWRINTLRGLGPALFGGTATTHIKVKPIEGNTDHDRIDESCQPNEKGVLCRLDGPLQLIVRTKKGEAKAVAVAGEQAEVEVRIATIYCRDI